MVLATDDDRFRYYASLFVDKCYQREEGIRNPFFLAPNYQMTEMQGAVALAQLERLDEFIEQRWRMATRLANALADVEGISLQRIRPKDKHSYFLFLFQLQPERLDCTAEEFAAALQHEGVNAKAHLITGGRPVYLYDLFQKRSAFPDSHYPFQSLDTGADRVYPQGLCPVAEKAFTRWITLEVLENYMSQMWMRSRWLLPKSRTTSLAMGGAAAQTFAAELAGFQRGSNISQGNNERHCFCRAWIEAQRDVELACFF